MTELTKECRLCGSTGPHQTITVREMYYGRREPFEYYVCATCETLQIVDALEGEELLRHYPREYYSYTAAAQPRIFEWITEQHDRFQLQVGGRLLGALITALPPGIRSVIGSPDASGDVVRMLGRVGVKRDARILDVGCGAGVLLNRLARVGFTNLSGADPFIDADFATPYGVPIAKRYMDEVTGKFDVIMFNHSLEHMPDPAETLRAARERLADGGICLVRLPTTSSEAWTVYGKDWCLIDAPRHMVVPSRRGMALAADRIGMRVESTFDDSNSSQFFGSELYRRDIALKELKSFGDVFRQFGLKQMWLWERRSKLLNRQGRGDQAGFILRPE